MPARAPNPCHPKGALPRAEKIITRPTVDFHQNMTKREPLAPCRRRHRLREGQECPQACPERLAQAGKAVRSPLAGLLEAFLGNLRRSNKHRS
jgi:hypothetical protein